jgi:hypothetical protein
MREPAAESPTFPGSVAGSAGASGLAGVSIPDRRRIDSDVRAFLREPSTPWIVFDQDQRPASQLAVLEVLPVALGSVIPEHGFFPATAAVDAPSGAALEPSSLAVAADLRDEPAVEDVAARRPRRRLVGLAVAAAGLLAVLAVGSSLGGRPVEPGRAGATAGAPVAADLPPPDLDVKSTPAPAATTPAAAPEERPLAKRFGRLSITGDARGRDVFLDGKRLLGRGARSFTVTCGMHAIAVGSRTDVHAMDVPCNAELVVSNK